MTRDTESEPIAESAPTGEGESTSKSTVAMARREYLRAVGVAGALGVSASFGSAAAQTAGETTYENPLHGPDFADPTIHRADDGTWWAYASNMSYSDPAEETLVPILSSPDLVNWTEEGEAFASEPGWTEGSIWAPDVQYHDGQWVLLYSKWPADRDANADLTGIGVATADTPDGPFTDHGKLFTNPDHPYPGNTIDPYFVAHEGTPYLFWGNFAGIYHVELTADLRDYRSGTFGQIVGGAYEGSTIFERDGDWYYFGSTGDCCDGFDSTYEIEVGRSEDGLFGPYYDREGTPMMERDEWNAGPTHLGDNDRFVAPGHGDVTVDDDGSHWFVYHAYDTEGPEIAGQYGWPPARQLFVDRVYWTDDGWPVVGGDGTPSLTAPVPNLGQRPAPVDDGTYRVRNAQSGHALAVESTEAGASAIVTTVDAGAHVEWTVTRLSGGEYVVENAESGLALEVADAATTDGADVQQWHPNGHPTQRWYLLDNGDGTYRLWDACGNAVGGRQIAEVANAAESAGASVQQWTDNGGAHQRWEFVPVDDSTSPETPPTLGDAPPTDPDGDGRFEDVDGNGRIDFPDVNLLFQNTDTAAVQDNTAFYDFSDDGAVDMQDVLALFEMV